MQCFYRRYSIEYLLYSMFKATRKTNCPILQMRKLRCREIDFFLSLSGSKRQEGLKLRTMRTWWFLGYEAGSEF